MPYKFSNLFPSKILVILLLTIVFLSGCSNEDIESITNKAEDIQTYVVSFVSNETARTEVKIDFAETIANAVINSKLQKINIEKIQTYDGYQMMIDRINLLIEIINPYLDKEIGTLSKDEGSYQKFLLAVNRYSPLIDNYNSLIEASYGFDPSNEASADRVISTTAGFTVEATLIFGGYVHKLTFKTVGELANFFGLTKMTSICGPCVSNTMSSMYWTGKTFVIEKFSELTETIIQQ